MSVKALGDNKFLVRVYNPHGREYRKVVAGKRAADAHEIDMRAKLASGRLLDPHGGKVLFGVYARQQIATRTLRPSTAERYERTLAQHIEPVFGHRPLRGIRHSDVAAFQTAMRRRFGEKHARDIVVLLRSVLRAATLDGLIDRNPAAGLRLEPIRHTERELPTWEQVRHVAETAPGETGFAIMLMALTGLRVSEVCGLAVADVATLKRELTVRRQLIYLPRQGFHYGPPKTSESARTVPIPALLVDSIAEHLTTSWDAVELGGQSHRLVLGRGKPVAGTSMANRVRDAARKVDVVLAPHTLRHLYTNTLLEAGVPLRTVDYVTGHRSVGMTVGVYAHVTPAALERTRAAAAGLWLALDDRPSATGSG
jgi:integrase